MTGIKWNIYIYVVFLILGLSSCAKSDIDLFKPQDCNKHNVSQHCVTSRIDTSQKVRRRFKNKNEQNRRRRHITLMIKEKIEAHQKRVSGFYCGKSQPRTIESIDFFNETDRKSITNIIPSKTVLYRCDDECGFCLTGTGHCSPIRNGIQHVDLEFIIIDAEFKREVRTITAENHTTCACDRMKQTPITIEETTSNVLMTTVNAIPSVPKVLLSTVEDIPSTTEVLLSTDQMSTTIEGLPTITYVAVNVNESLINKSRERHDLETVRKTQNISDAIAYMANKIGVLEKEVHRLKGNVILRRHFVNKEFLIEKIIFEIKERDARRQNLIVYGLNECDSNDCIESDQETIDKIIKIISKSTKKTVIKISRIGDRNKINNKPRRIKIVFENSNDAERVFRMRRKLKLIPEYNKIKIIRDHTKLQKRYRKFVSRILSERIKNGETGIYLKDISGIPTIIKM